MSWCAWSTWRASSAARCTAAWLLTYANLSPHPGNSRVPELPVVDWLFDGSNDFAALWDASLGGRAALPPGDQLVYDELARLGDRRRRSITAPIGEQLAAGTPDGATLAALAAALDDDYAPGTYLALTTVPAPDQHQIGFDATPLCAMRDTFADNMLAAARDPSRRAAADRPHPHRLLRCANRTPVQRARGLDASGHRCLRDAADGELQGSDVAAGEVDEALRTPLTFVAGDATDFARAAVVLAASRRPPRRRAPR